MDTVMSNQLGKMTNAQFEELQTQITQIILEKERTSTDNTKPKVAESENIEANHLGFAKFLFQHYCQYLGLNHNHIFAESVFNFYINEKISSLLETPINKEIEHYTQQRYPIIYASKGKGKLQTPAQPILPLYTWKHYQHIINRHVSINSTESEKEKEESEDQEFTYQNLIIENLEVKTPNFQTQQNLNLENSEIETPNHQRQNNSNSKLINQQNLPPPPQPPNLDPMAYAPITKLDNFTSEEDDTQVWLNDDTANSWYQNLINKPQDFTAFKAEFLKYFSNNNSINRLVNTFTTMKQGETEAVTTYLGCFHQNLRQIQAIDANYFTAPQILNQFICGLRSSILQHVHPLDFESAQSEANHAQAVNLVINGSSELDSKLEKFSESINKRLEGYLADNYAIY
ncbi:hypothetical protein G9A89_004822 [Geosiphon pyriformis]|nr:hypothetical protein G9A89_004822 [Geosiphon pyriformis]